MKSGNIRRSNKDETPDFWQRPLRGDKTTKPKTTTELVPVKDRVFKLTTVKLKTSK